MSNKKTGTNVALAIMGVLILILIALEIYSLSTPNLIFFCDLAALVCTALYGFFLYKKPHGNMLKYTMLIFAASNLVIAIQMLWYNVGSAYVHAISLVIAGMLCYVAGRLNRIEQNRFILLIALVLFVIRSVASLILFPTPSFITNFTICGQPIIMFLTLCCAYFVRYKAHKEAGLADK